MENFDPIQEQGPIKNNSNKGFVIFIVIILIIMGVSKIDFTALKEKIANVEAALESDGYPEVDTYDNSYSQFFEQKNVLVTYNDEIIEFNIPNGFEAYSYDDESYKLFEKELEDDYINVDVYIEYDSMDEFVEDVKQNAQDLETDYYSNIQVSNPVDIKVNGNKFKKISISFDYLLWDGEIEKHENVYYAHEIDNENLYVVEIQGANFVTNSEIETFLTIKKIRY